MHEKNSRIHLGQITKTNTQIAKELKITPIFGQITGIQEKLDTGCK
jgi:hypothetical protein